MNDMEAWRRWRSRFYLGILIAGMVAIAVAGAWNVRRLSRMAAPPPPAGAAR